MDSAVQPPQKLVFADPTWRLYDRKATAIPHGHCTALPYLRPHVQTKTNPPNTAAIPCTTILKAAGFLELNADALRAIPQSPLVPLSEFVVANRPAHPRLRPIAVALDHPISTHRRPVSTRAARRPLKPDRENIGHPRTTCDPPIDFGPYQYRHSRPPPLARH